MDNLAARSSTDVRLAERRASRANRACITCRARKQRCIPPADQQRQQAPCQRCQRHKITCSFENDQTPSVPENIGPSQLSHIIIQLQKRINTHEVRIAELETSHSHTQSTSNHDATPRLDTHVDQPDQQLQTLSPTPGAENRLAASEDVGHTVSRKSDTCSPLPQTLRFDMDTLEFASPIATLRSLGALDGEHGNCFPPYDPIACGIITIQEAHDALNIYFDHCHPWAPALSESLRCSGEAIRQSSPALFITIVSVGTRFWHNGSVHPRYFEIIALLDKAIARLLLYPTPKDASVDTIRALMLYLQWMPCSRKDSINAVQDGRGHGAKLRTRYNDMSAWAIFGLALRYSTFLSLDRQALGPFRPNRSKVISNNDMDIMRTWLNLLTYDCSLTLTSGLPVSLDPLPAAKVVREFCAHTSAQDPGDIRYAALIELACIVQRAKCVDVSVSHGQATITSLKKANIEMEEWEHYWIPKLKNTSLQHIQLPFTSLRWYRLSLNSSVLRPLLSSSTTTETNCVQVWTVGFLETSITAASQILLSITHDANQVIWSLSSQVLSTYPTGAFGIDSTARTSLHHAVDATWISFTFALTFLVLCYIRKTINDDLQIIGIPATTRAAVYAPSKPRRDSLLARLARLAVSIFEAESGGRELRLDGGYETIIRNAASLILDHDQDRTTSQMDPISADPLDPALQSLFDLMDDTVYDWPSMHETDVARDANFADIWGPR